MKYGFTGTSRQPLTHYQRVALRETLHVLFPDVCEFHHGDCINADAEAAGIAREYGLWIVVHPSILLSKRAYTLFDESRPLLPPLKRNHNIVDDTDVLIACPGENHERLRSGTWATVRYARKQRKPIVILYPAIATQPRKERSHEDLLRVRVP